eukprot:530814-Alexandrium_andersonii.AAC.1
MYGGTAQPRTHRLGACCASDTDDGGQPIARAALAAPEPLSVATGAFDARGVQPPKLSAVPTGCLDDCHDLPVLPEPQ